MILSIFSCACRPSVFVLWRNLGPYLGRLFRSSAPFLVELFFVPELHELLYSLDISPLVVVVVVVVVVVIFPPSL